MFEVKYTFGHKYMQMLYQTPNYGLGCKNKAKLEASTYLHYDSLVRDAAHHLIDGLKELQQGLPEVCFPFVFIKSEK